MEIALEESGGTKSIFAGLKHSQIWRQQPFPGRIRSHDISKRRSISQHAPSNLSKKMVVQVSESVVTTVYHRYPPAPCYGYAYHQRAPRYFYRSLLPCHRSAFRPTPSSWRPKDYQLRVYNPPHPLQTPRVSNVGDSDEVEAAAALTSLCRSVSPQKPVSTQAPQKSKPLLLRQCQTEQKPIPLRLPTTAIVTPSETSDEASFSSYDKSVRPQGTEWYTGSTSLSLSDDDEVLSPLHCFLRRYCVEAFSATAQDVATPRYCKSHGNKIVVDQVGIRCLHCKNLPIQSRPERAVCYPSSLRNIYHSIETWQRRHSVLCEDIPGWIKRDLTKLIQSSRSTAGGRRQYWEGSAKKLGLVDTPRGVRFARPPGLIEATDRILDQGMQIAASPKESIPLVTPSDKSAVTEYLFILMDQMETCQFTEQDRIGGRSKVKDFEVGFPGMHCKHCRGKAGFGRYFPSSIDALAMANSDRNIYNHLRKCRRCPEHIKFELRRLQQQHSVLKSKNKRGSRKQFFVNIWGRIHET